MKVRIQVIKVYDIEVAAEEEDAAIEEAYGMETALIERNGHIVSTSSDYAEMLP